MAAKKKKNAEVVSLAAYRHSKQRSQKYVTPEEPPSVVIIAGAQYDVISSVRDVKDLLEITPVGSKDYLLINTHGVLTKEAVRHLIDTLASVHKRMQ